VDDDELIREAIQGMLKSVGVRCEVFATPEEFLRRKRPDVPSCLILDGRFPGVSGLDFQKELIGAGVAIPTIFITGHGDIPMSVKAMKSGAVEFLTKPFRDEDLLDAIRQALDAAGATKLATLDTVLARGYENSIDLSGGQWQRIALARALCAVRLGAGVVILDEPTAQLDVRGESEIFERILAATRQCTTILISHRFSTVRQADRICVLEKGKVVEFGSHRELMALNGRYRTMFDLQAQRFSAEDEEGKAYDVLA